jgi:molecular chaperone GrpE
LRSQYMPKDSNLPEEKGFLVRDQRFWLREDALAEMPERAEARKPSFVEDLQARLEDKDRVLREYIQAHKSSESDLDGVRQRLEQELHRRVDIEKARIAASFLEVGDNLERLHQAARSAQSQGDLGTGIALIIRQLKDRLLQIGLKEVVAKGERFDPNTMEALMTSEVPAEQDGMVLDEVRTGFVLGDLVVRPAGVRVGIAERG